MKTVGFVLLSVLISSLFANVAFVEAKTNYIQQSSVKKDIRDVAQPREDKTVKIISTTKSRFLAILYIVGIQVCAGREKIYSPELEIKSDREEMTVKMAGLIMSNSCKSSEFFIRANNPDSISVEFAKARHAQIPASK